MILVIKKLLGKPCLFADNKLIGHSNDQGKLFLKLCPDCESLTTPVYGKQGICAKCGFDLNKESIKHG